MTIDDVKRLPGTGSSKYGQGASYKITFQVYFSNGYSEPALRLNTDGRLPKVGMKLGDETGAVATDTAVYADSVDLQLMSEESPYATDAKGIALYTVNYQQITAGFSANPLDRVDVEWGGAEDSETVKQDVDGNAILNSAGELYSPLPMRPIRGAEVCITIRQSANPSLIVATYSYSTNSAAMWTEVDAENGLMGKIRARLVQENATKYWEVSFPIKFRRDSWRLKLIDNGTVFLNDDGEQQTVTDDLGNVKAVPSLLDGSGDALAPSGTPVIYPTDGYEINEKLDWAALSLPNPFTYTG